MLKQLGEIIRVAASDLLGDFRNGEIAAAKQPHRLVDANEIDVFDECGAGGFLEYFAKMIRVEIHHRCRLGHGNRLRIMRIDMEQQLLEAIRIARMGQIRPPLLFPGHETAGQQGKQHVQQALDH
ncbi:hypothetical protein D3C77_532890 [compost metagenome]